MSKVNVKLKEILENRKITVYSLSKKIDISQHNLSKLVNNDTSSIRFDTLIKLCEELNIEISDLIEIIED